ncbi:unnamed protein product [Brassica oleracea var. botrytis]
MEQEAAERSTTIVASKTGDSSLAISTALTSKETYFSKTLSSIAA